MPSLLVTFEQCVAKNRTHTETHTHQDIQSYGRPRVRSLPFLSDNTRLLRHPVCLRGDRGGIDLPVASLQRTGREIIVVINSSPLCHYVHVAALCHH